MSSDQAVTGEVAQELLSTADSMRQCQQAASARHSAPDRACDRHRGHQRSRGTVLPVPRAQPRGSATLGRSHHRHSRVPAAARGDRRSDAGRTGRRRLPAKHHVDDPDDVDRDGAPVRAVLPCDPRCATSYGAPEPSLRMGTSVLRTSRGIGLGGPAAKPYIPLFASFFILILFCNWIGLVPPVGKLEELRAPTSDVNINDRPGPRVVHLSSNTRIPRRLGVGGYLRLSLPG